MQEIEVANEFQWDRYGIGSMKLYGENIDGILGSFDRLFPNAIVLFLSALPVSNSSKGWSRLWNIVSEIYLLFKDLLFPIWTIFDLFYVVGLREKIPRSMFSS